MLCVLIYVYVCLLSDRCSCTASLAAELCIVSRSSASAGSIYKRGASYRFPVRHGVAKAKTNTPPWPAARKTCLSQGGHIVCQVSLYPEGTRQQQRQLLPSWGHFEDAHSAWWRADAPAQPKKKNRLAMHDGLPMSLRLLSHASGHIRLEPQVQHPILT